jgi:pimeloyl-ACP methyl ester carboxylesterase
MLRFAFTVPALLLIGALCAGPGCRFAGENVSAKGKTDRASDSSELGLLEKIPGADLFGLSRPQEEKQELGLYAVTPFDPNKVPVVMVHGLVSDPNTWDEMLGQLSEEPEIVRNYQFWMFLYPPENSILKSASDLRGSLQDAMKQLDPKRENARLSNMVLIGHSIGGLLAKFQVTHSDEKLWDAVANQPIEKLGVDHQARKTIRDTFFFAPQPMIRKVIYIGVPHGDAAQSEDGNRRLGHRLFDLSGSLRKSYRQLVNDSDSQLIDQEAGIQIDDDPFTAESPILKATQDLRMGAGVTAHSIIGNANSMSDGSPGDGLVAVEIAKIKDSESDWYVSAPHADLHRTEDSIREVKRILVKHLADASRFNELQPRNNK